MPKKSRKRGRSHKIRILDDQEEYPTKITLFGYGPELLYETETTDIQKCLRMTRKKGNVIWINVDGLKNKKILEELTKSFGIHPLVTEDILDTGQRAKMEEYDEYFYIVARMLGYNNSDIESEQVSIILGKTFVISIQEKEGDLFDNVRSRIRNNKGKIRKGGADYLAYALLDAIVDNYYVILEKLGEEIEILEDEVLTASSIDTATSIHQLKRSMISLRKSVWPLREVAGALERESRGRSSLITKNTSVYLRDLYDHTIQVIDTIETQRDIVAGMLDIYLSSVSNKMNEVMKVLTVIATVFIPLTFITGVYGMNFRFMPELEHPYGYFAVITFMMVLGLVMMYYFRRKRWI